MQIERHGLIMLSTEAAQRIASRVWNEWFKQSNLSQSEWYLSLLNGLIPAIARRGSEDEFQYGIPVGISLPVRLQSQRVRLTECLKENEVARYVTPYQVASLPHMSTSLSLQVFSEFAENWPFAKEQLGIWGSNALQIITGLEYTDKSSDLDVLIRGCNKEQLVVVNNYVGELERKHNIRIDIEIALDNGYGINFKEFIQPGKRILAKGLTDVVLLDKTELAIN